MTEYLNLEDILAAAAAALGHPPDVRDIGILEGAAARPRASAFGAEIYADIHAKAAALVHSLVTGHGLVDGNKRLGWIALRLFYRLNDLDLRLPPADAFELITGVADGSIRDVPVIADHLRDWVMDVEGR